MTSTSSRAYEKNADKQLQKQPYPVLTMKNSESEEAEEWLNNLRKIKRSINPELIDMNDERTIYIMSKCNFAL